MPVPSPFPTLPVADNRELKLHYLNGVIKQDPDTAFVRVYPDPLSPRLYILIEISYIRDWIEWTSEELTTFGISPLQNGTYCSVGIEYGVPLSIVKVKNMFAGGPESKILMGASPKAMRASDINAASKKKMDLMGPTYWANGDSGGNGGDFERGERSTPITSTN